MAAFKINSELSDGSLREFGIDLTRFIFPHITRPRVPFLLYLSFNIEWDKLV
jgi:hypothetical protein